MKKFIKTKENFICEHCKKYVEGTGYTNHCPLCLFSKHVDVNPGDRISECHGMMEPVEAETEKGIDYVILKCQKCGHKKRNKLAENDEIDVIIKLAKDRNI